MALNSQPWTQEILYQDFSKTLGRVYNLDMSFKDPRNFIITGFAHILRFPTPAIRCSKNLPMYIYSWFIPSNLNRSIRGL